MAEEVPTDATPVTFNIKSSNDARYTLTVPLSTTVLELKQKLSTSDYAEIPPERQRLIYSGRVLKDNDTLDSYKIKEGNTVHLVKGAASTLRQTPANQGSSAAPAPSGVPTNIAAGTGNNPLAGLTGARYAGFAQLPSENMFGPDGGMGPPPGPEQMISMLQNPQFASTLNEALQNPQLIDMMIQQNPALRSMGPEVRQMMQTPEFRRMITDPEQIRHMTQLQRMLGDAGMPGMGGSGASAFPAPGATDNTPGQEGNRGTPSNPQPPFNPTAMFGNPAAVGGAQAGNPFAALFNPAAFGNPSAATGTPPAAPTATQATPSQGQRSTSPQQAPNPATNPFANSAFFNNPAAMQQMLQAMGGTGAQNPAAAPDPATNPFGALFAPGGMLAGGGTPPVQDTRPPEERYEAQLRQLNDMGFHEFERNVEALRRTGGSMQGAVEYLLTH